jgi:hypothetical protein
MFLFRGGCGSGREGNRLFGGDHGFLLSCSSCDASSCGRSSTCADSRPFAASCDGADDGARGGTSANLGGITFRVALSFIARCDNCWSKVKSFFRRRSRT